MLTGESKAPDGSCLGHFTPLELPEVPKVQYRTRTVPLIVFPKVPPEGIQAALEDTYPNAEIHYKTVSYRANGSAVAMGVEITEEVTDDLD